MPHSRHAPAFALLLAAALSLPAPAPGQSFQPPAAQAPTPPGAPQDAAANDPEMRFRVECSGNHSDSCVVVAEGRITERTPDRFAALHDDGEIEGNRVLFDSRGGALVGGLALGRMLRERGFETEVGRWEPDGGIGGRVVPGGTCASACAYAFLGGTLRRVATGNRLGFHQFHLTRPGMRQTDGSVLGSAETAQVLASEIITYLVEMDVDARIFARGTEAGRLAMRYASETEMLTYGLVTPEGFEPFFLEPWRDGIVAASRRRGPTRLYDTLTQITAYCRDDAAHLLLSFEGFAAAGGGRLTVEAGGNERVITLPAERARPRGDTAVEIRLAAAERDALRSADGFTVELNRGMVGGGPITGSFTLREDDRSRLVAAFRFCI